MKSKFSKIMGVGFALVLVASLMLFALPAQADPYDPLHPPAPNMWQGFPPTPSAGGLWFFDPAITQVGPNAQAINGDFYTYVAGTAATLQNIGTDDIFKSVDGGRTWTVSQVPAYYAGGAVVDMVCSSMSEDVIYLTDGNYVYRSINGGVTFTLVAAEDLEFELVGTCGTPITLLPITSIDVGYDGSGQPMVFIGTKDVGENYDDTDAYDIVGSVYWIADQTFDADWRDLQVRCYGCCDWPTGTPVTGCSDVYAVAAAPGFENINKVYAVVTAPLTGITFTTAATVTIRAGDAGAEFNWDSSIDAVTGLSGTAGVGDNTTGTTTMPASVPPNTEYTIIFAPGTAGTVYITMVDGTISWRVSAGSGVTFCGGTYVISTLGTVCSWSTVTEVRWNCLWSFTIEHASRIKFPSYYATEPTLFVGVAAVNDQSSAPTTLNGPGEGGDVYRVADTVPASGVIDLNVQGFTTGCTGFSHANIQSLDICNDALAAGARNSYQFQSPTRVYYSADGGWTWSPSLKDPTGTSLTYVLFDQATCAIHAATAGCSAAWSLDCGANPGQFFNQISLIDMNIEHVLDLTHSPGYAVDSSTLFVLTQDTDACGSTDTINSLLRWDGTYWERVHSSCFYAALLQTFVWEPLYDWVEVSPDFNSTSVLYMANTGFYMTRSIDAGCSWASLIYPCYDRPAISAWIVVDEETVLAAGGNPNNGYVYRTLNHGAQPWSVFAVAAFPGGLAANGVDFDLSLPRNADSDLLLGDAAGQVFFSGDLGATWAEICDVVGNADFAGAYNTYVVFDPGYGVTDDPGVSMIYAAAGQVVGRCALDLAGALPFKQDWVYISSAAAACDPFTMQMASGIDAAGDTALYVSDTGDESGTARSVTIDGSFTLLGLTSGFSTDVLVSTVTPTPIPVTELAGTLFLDTELVDITGSNFTVDPDTTLIGELTLAGVSSAASGISETITITVPAAGFTVGEGVIVMSSALTATVTGAGVTTYSTGVWRTLNPMALMPPVFPVPLVEWEFLYTPTSALNLPNSLRHPVADAFSPLVYPDDLWLTLTAASNVLWALDDVPEDSPSPYIWIWDDPLARPVIQIQPADGTLLATTTSATIEWQPLDNATLYEYFIFSYCATCPDNMVLFLNSTTADTCIVIPGLTPGTKYFWKVRAACNSPQVSKWSALHSFDTALDTVPFLCAPWCGQDDVILTTNFAWDAVAGALSYELQIVAASADGTADWTGAANYTSAENAYASIPGLEYSTVYYWRVRSVNASIYSAWAVCLFTTADVPAEPVDPLPPVEVITEEITPIWIWVIIAIGGALTIAVVILIVTTRRVP